MELSHSLSLVMMCATSILVVALAYFATAQTQTPTVKLSGGANVLGFIDPANPSVEQYLGIPYGVAPVGELRFAPPQPAKPPASVNATSTPFACMQFDPTKQPGGPEGTPTEFANTAPISEDCLSLSVRSPVERGSRKLPVLIFIYGGGFLLGSTTVAYQDPTQWIQRTKNLIVVEMNYRMNIFGFPNAAGLDQRKMNLGLMDQRLAVEWIRDNIGAFGGDPNRMVLWGQSAGAASVDLYNYAHYDDPIVRGLIMDSGSASLISSADTKHTSFTTVASKVGCGNLTATAELSCMRNANSTAIINAFTTALLTGQASFAPVPDDVTVFANVTERALQGKIAQIPAIMGTNGNEDFGPGLPVSMTCTTIRAIKARQAAGVLTYRYLYSGNFTNVTPNGAGAVHSAELPLLFGTHGNFRGNSTPYEIEVSETMQDNWYSFVSSGGGWSPNTEASPNVRQFGVAGGPAYQPIVGTSLDAGCS